MKGCDVPVQRSVRTGSDVCEYCGRKLEADQGLDVVVADSGYQHPTDPDQDGRRAARVCSRQHAQALAEHFKQRWVDEELWATKLRRVIVYWGNAETTLDGIAKRAGLTMPQLLRAVNRSTEAGSHRVGDSNDKSGQPDRLR